MSQLPDFLIRTLIVVSLAWSCKEKDDETTEEDAISETDPGTATEDEGLSLYSSCTSGGANSITHALLIEESKITRYEVFSKDNALCLPNSNIFAWAKGESFTEDEFLSSLNEQYAGTTGVSKLEITDTEVIYKKDGTNLYNSFKKRAGYSDFVFDSAKEITWEITQNDISTIAADQRKIEAGVRITQPDGIDFSPVLSCLKSLGSTNSFTDLYGTTNSDTNGQYTMEATINDANNTFTLPLTCFIRIDSNISSFLSNRYFLTSKSFSVQ